MPPVKITGLVMDHVQKVQAVEFELSPEGLTKIGGNNRQGKTTILRMIAATLGGAKYIPPNVINDEAEEGWSELHLSNGITARREFSETGTKLRVTGPDGKGTQTLLNEFVCTFALDLPSFLDAGEKKQAGILLESLGIDLEPYETRIKTIFKEREDIGRDKIKANGHLESLPHHEEVGSELKSASSLSASLIQIQDVNRQNGETRDKLRALEVSLSNEQENNEEINTELADLEIKRLEIITRQKESDEAIATLETRIEKGKVVITALVDKDPAPVQKEINQLDQHNNMVQHNLDWEKAQDELAQYSDQYTVKSVVLAQARKDKLDLLESADWPLPDMTVEDGELKYQDKNWNAMAHADQMKLAVAIVASIQPDMGFVLIDKLEALDLASQEDLDQFLRARGLQAISTIVSQGDECTLIIEEGRVQ